MASFFRKFFAKKKKKFTRKDSITGRNHSFVRFTNLDHLFFKMENLDCPILIATWRQSTSTWAVIDNSRIYHRFKSRAKLILTRKMLGDEDFIINLTAGPKVELDDENDTLDSRLLAMRVDVKKGKIFLNACINNEWGKLVIFYSNEIVAWKHMLTMNGWCWMASQEKRLILSPAFWVGANGAYQIDITDYEYAKCALCI